MAAVSFALFSNPALSYPPRGHEASVCRAAAFVFKRTPPTCPTSAASTGQEWFLRGMQTLGWGESPYAAHALRQLQY